MVVSIPGQHEVKPTQSSDGSGPSVKELVTTVRPKTHGEFRNVAEVEQHLKNYFRLRNGWAHLNDHQRAALDMIAHKVARIFAGDPNFADHWVDIAGYAQLVADRCPK